MPSSGSALSTTSSKDAKCHRDKVIPYFPFFLLIPISLSSCSVAVEGWLRKESPKQLGGFRIWQKRWFVLMVSWGHSTTLHGRYNTVVATSGVGRLARLP